MRELINTLVDWIYPPKCMSCRNLLPLQNKHGRGLWLCAYCENLFLPLEGPGCKICSAPLKSQAADDQYPGQPAPYPELDLDDSFEDELLAAYKTHPNPPISRPTICSSCSTKTFHFTQNRAAFAYEDLVRDLIHEIKFRRRKHVAQGLGRLWANMAAKSIPDDTTLVPLPMHPKKRRARGFDQAEVLAVALATATGTQPALILERTQNTPPQSGLHPRQRAENVRGAFRIKPGVDVKGKNYILVDDIYTTGASLNECARILKASGAAEVSAMTLAIAIKKDNPDDKRQVRT